MTTVIVFAFNPIWDEEYGYRFWRWETGMTKDELIAFWQGIESMSPHFMNPSTNMPGKWTEINHSDIDQTMVVFRAHIHTDEDSSLYSPDSGLYFHKGHTGIQP